MRRTFQNSTTCGRGPVAGAGTSAARRRTQPKSCPGFPERRLQAAPAPRLLRHVRMELVLRALKDSEIFHVAVIFLQLRHCLCVVARVPLGHISPFQRQRSSWRPYGRSDDNRLPQKTMIIIISKNKISRCTNRHLKASEASWRYPVSWARSYVFAVLHGFPTAQHGPSARPEPADDSCLAPAARRSPEASARAAAPWTLFFISHAPKTVNLDKKCSLQRAITMLAYYLGTIYSCDALGGLV